MNDDLSCAVCCAHNLSGSGPPAELVAAEPGEQCTGEHLHGWADGQGGFIMVG